MISLIVRYGVIGGLIITIPMLWRMLTAKPGDVPVVGMLLTYLVMLVALTTVFLGIKQYRDKMLGGAIRFLPAFGVGLGITTIASIVYVIGWEVSSAYSSFDFVLFYKNLMIKSGQTVAEAESFATMYANPWYRMPMTFIEMFPVGVVVSLISAAVLRNSRVLPARAPG